MTTTNRSLLGKSAVVTGSTSDIGLGIAAALAEQGGGGGVSTEKAAGEGSGVCTGRRVSQHPPRGRGVYGPQDRRRRVAAEFAKTPQKPTIHLIERAALLGVSIQRQPRR